MAVGDELPLLPPSETPAAPSLAEQQRQHAADNPPPPPPSSGDNLPMAPASQPPLMNSSWSQLGKTLWDEGSRGVELGTRAVAEGLGGIAGGLGDLLTYPGRALGKAIGFQPAPFQTDFYAPPSQQIQSAIDKTGLPVPQTPTERNISTFERAAAPVALGAATNPTATIPSIVRSATAGGVGGLAGEKAAQSDFVPPWLKPSANLVASMLAAKGADVATNLGYKVGNAVTGNMSPEYAAFQRQGIPTSLLGTVGGGEAGQAAEAALSRVPFASSVIRPVQQQTVDAFGNAVDRTALQLDPTRSAVTAETTGKVVQDAARNWKDNFFQVQQPAVWTPLNQRLAGSAVDLSGYQKALDSVTAQLSLPATQKALTPGLAMQLRLALSQDVPGGTVTWEQAQQLRTLIGQTMGVPEIAQSIGMDALKRAYAGIASDMRTTAAANGQGNVFDAANKFSTDGHAFIEGPLSKVISTNNPAQESIRPEQATNAVLHGGDTTMQAVRNQLPDAADALAAYKLRQMATAKPGTATAYNDTSTGTFLTNVNRMRQDTPGGYNALYNTPTVQQQLDDLATVAGRLRATERHLNTSGTAEQLGWMGYAKGIADAATEMRPGKVLGQMVIPPAVGYGGGKMMTSPTLTRFAAAQGGGPPLIPPSAAGLLGAIPQLTGQ